MCWKVPNVSFCNSWSSLRSLRSETCKFATSVGLPTLSGCSLVLRRWYLANFNFLTNLNMSTLVCAYFILLVGQYDSPEDKICCYFGVQTLEDKLIPGTVELSLTFTSILVVWILCFLLHFLRSFCFLILLRLVSIAALPVSGFDACPYQGEFIQCTDLMYLHIFRFSFPQCDFCFQLIMIGRLVPWSCAPQWLMLVWCTPRSGLHSEACRWQSGVATKSQYGNTEIWTQLRVQCVLGFNIRVKMCGVWSQGPGICRALTDIQWSQSTDSRIEGRRLGCTGVCTAPTEWHCGCVHGTVSLRVRVWSTH